MNINTKYFGWVQIADSQCLTFPGGIPGFETHDQYVLIPFEENDDTILCLQSKDSPELAFTLLNPFYLEPDYEPRLTDEDLATLRCEPSSKLAFYALAVVREPFSDTTVNLKCPIAVNPENRLALQVVMDDDRYSMRHPLSPFGDGGKEG